MQEPAMLDHVNENTIVFVVGSPLQLLNAIEARDRFHLQDKTHIFVIWAKSVEYQQMCQMLDAEWSETYIYQHTKAFKLFYSWMLSSVLTTLGSVHRLYLGYPFKIRAHFANQLKAEKTIFLDDGNASLILAQELSGQVLYQKHQPQWYDHVLLRKIDLQYAKNAYFFTAYTEMQWPLEKVIPNDYRCIKQHVDSVNCGVNTEVMFIGSAIAGAVVNTEQEKHLIRAMANYYQESQVLYVLHRFEDFAYFQSEFKELNITFVQFDSAVELALFQNKIYPKKISSFCSSALNTLAMLYDCHFEVLAIPQHWMETSVAKRLEIIYEDFAQRGIFIQDITKEINNVA